ncbi:MAG: hypothetical protein KAT28_00560 [Candidatus Aenigmarchaeota archaeon]|nr:hypothetical protein [Candidatus Aenigmarchaeota archaeon]
MEVLHLAGSLFDLEKIPEEVYKNFHNRGFGVPLTVLKAYQIYHEANGTTEDDFTDALHKVYTQNSGPFKNFNEYLYYIGKPEFTEIIESDDSSKINKNNPYLLMLSLREENEKAGLKNEDNELDRGLEILMRLRKL